MNSGNQFVQFVQQVSQSQELQQQIQQGVQEERESFQAAQESFLNKVVELGKANGYNFTTNEVQHWLLSRRESTGESELSDEQLESVAGQTKDCPGGTLPPRCPRETTKYNC